MYITHGLELLQNSHLKKAPNMNHSYTHTILLNKQVNHLYTHFVKTFVNTDKPNDFGKNLKLSSLPH